MKQILIDGRMIQRNSHGIAEYLKGYLREWSKIQPDLSNVQLDLLISPETFSNERFEIIHKYVACSTPFMHPLEGLAIDRALKEKSYGLFYSPSIASPLLSSTPSILTIHDLNHLKFGHVLHRINYETILRHSIARANTALTISNTIQNEISEWLDHPPLQIAPNLFDDCLLKAAPPQTQKHIWLIVTNEKPHKQAKEGIIQIEKLQKFIAGTKIDRPEVYATVSDEFLHQLGATYTQSVGNRFQSIFNQATTLLTFSRYEGLGRTITEAQLAGKHLIATHIPSHLEASQFCPSSSFFPYWIDPDHPSLWHNVFLHHLTTKNSIASNQRNCPKLKQLNELHANALWITIQRAFEQ